MSDIREELELAAFIRKIDGNNKMGAGRLAEKILDWQAARAQEGGEAVAWRCTEKHSNISDVVGAVDAMETYKRFGRKVEPLYTHPSASVPEGYVLVEKGITPAHVLEAGLECFRLLNQSGIADDRTLVLSVFQDMLLAIDKERATTPQPANNWIKCSERLQSELVDMLDNGDSADHYSVLRDLVYEAGLNRPNPPEQESES